MKKRVLTCSNLDNNDGTQETLAGSGTMHNTNLKLFQSLILLELSTGCISGQRETCLGLLSTEQDISEDAAFHVLFTLWSSCV